ncbi:unnamed protein product, partial [Staurois parvus]
MVRTCREQEEFLRSASGTEQQLHRLGDCSLSLHITSVLPTNVV